MIFCTKFLKVNTQAKTVDMALGSGTFVEYLIQTSGKTFNYLSRFKTEISTATTHNEFEFALAIEMMNLLRSLLTQEGWYDEVSRLLSKYSQLAPKIVGTVSAQAHMECESGESSTNVAPAIIIDLNNIFGLLAMLGGHLSGAYTGTQAWYHTGSDTGDGIAEECTIVAPTWPQKETSEKNSVWSGLEDLGDAIYVVLKSQVPLFHFSPVGQFLIHVSFCTHVNLHTTESQLY